MDDFDINKVDIDTSGVFIPRRLEGRKDQLVKEILRSLEITKIYPDGSVDVDGNVSLKNLDLVKLPIKFNKVSGYFDCSRNNLTSLAGCPKEEGDSFDCHNNKLTSLKGCPIEVGNSFNCSCNKLISLGRYSIKTNIRSYDKKIATSLVKLGGYFNCYGNLETLL